MPQRTIEQIYQKKSPIEHILIRPDTYVGSIELQKSHKWVHPHGATQFQYKEIHIVPALFKIFDQILVNAADNYQRDRRMNLIKVQINQEEGFISVYNNGKGIPVQIHKEHKIYVPELIFGHLLTGSNYDDQEKKVVGGRNGYGAKLANIFSKKFVVECADGHRKKLFKMIWRNNMMEHSEADISPYSGGDYTRITFHPQFSRFKMSSLDDDTFSFLSKRVYDVAGLLHRVKVFLNGKQISFPTFNNYVDMYYEPESNNIKIWDQNVNNDRWEIVVSTSEGEFRQVSFVNGICTTKGGTHVSYIADQIVQKIQQKIKKKKDKNLVVKPFQIKAHLWLFVNCLVQNPTFDSQTKQTLTLKQSQFGSQCPLSQKMIKQILNSGIVDDIFNQAKAKELSKLARVTAGQKKSRLTGIPKLQDANQAGTRNSDKCTLILTEGDSAKSLAMAGLEIIGRDYYGVFPLKGKLLNVREATNNILMKNQETQNLIKIVGLQINKKYEDLRSLRYGSVMIMSDQDTDGSHIKGLVINFVHTFWPSLFQIEGFLKQFITPLLKVSKGRQTISFYTMSDYKTWCEAIPNIKTWKIKYYKGLGTSSDKEAQEYFKDLAKHKIDFKYVDQEDDQAMELIFSRKNIEKRKEWLSCYDPSAVMVYDRPKIRYKEFVDKEFIHFSNEDNIRSIASIIDGFKPGQRKIIYGCFKRNLKEQIKVAQLSGYVSEHSAYHHGQVSLTETIVGMAQNFVGANNIILLMPNGQFGSRNQGGKDHASARYIFTNLNRISRLIFPQPDDHTLTYVEDDGQVVEPEYYMPILPMSLVNGCQGIGTGWSTFIPNFNPRELVEMLLLKLTKNEQFKNLKPWYKGFQGEIVAKQGTELNYETKGILEVDIEQNTIHIRELPIGKWTKEYKVFLDQMMMENDRIEALREYHTKNRVHFQLQVKEQFIEKYGNNQDYLQKLFKISSNMSLNNMVGFNQHHKIIKYPSAQSILGQFYQIRMTFYHKRKEYLVSKLVRQLDILSMKQKFIIYIVQERIIIRNKKKLQICQTLKRNGFKKFNEFPSVKSTKVVAKKEKGQNQEEDEQQDQTTNSSVTEYNYLLSLPLWSLTYQKVEEIKKQKREKAEQLLCLQNTTASSMWVNDLNEFLKELDRYQAIEEEERLKGLDSKVKGNKGKNKRPVKNKEKDKKKDKGKAKIKDKALNWDSQESNDEQQKKTAKPKEKQKEKIFQSKPNQKKNKQKNQEQKQHTSCEEQMDLISRMKKKINQGQARIPATVIANPSKKTDPYSSSADEYEMVRVKASKATTSKKKRMELQSSSSQSEQRYKID